MKNETKSKYGFYKKNEKRRTECENKHNKRDM
jgi:hypothetical protein